ncbi:MAG: bifunctional pyr operon transcriptional regulator/uracil phosphoribosyltransferase PyrR [Myxococcota bacterium]
MPTRLFDAAVIEGHIAKLAEDIHRRYREEQENSLDLLPGELCLVGIRTGGAVLAARLADRLAAFTVRPPLGILDITLYRDDVLLGPNPVPVLRGSDIPFDLHRRYVVLVDDVLFTGRTVRAALDALLDLGRPGCVRLAVLVDRGLRELPICADFVAARLQTRLGDRVAVRLDEGNPANDEVTLVPALLGPSSEAT